MAPAEVAVSCPLVETLMLGTIDIEKAQKITDSMLRGLAATATGKAFRNFDDEAKSESEKVMGQLQDAMQLAGVCSIEELMSKYDERLFDMVLQQFSNKSD